MDVRKGLNVLMALMIALLILPVFANAQWYQEPLEWDGVTTKVMDKTDVDTTDAFLIPKDYVGAARYGKDYPAKLAWQFNTIEENDSTYVTFKYQLSFDGSYWITATLFDTIKTEDGISVKVLASFLPALYGRIITTGAMATGDTLTLSGTFAKVY